jgi:hypothetical protein
MSRSNHTEAQNIGALKQLEARRKADVAREVGVSKHTIYLESKVRRDGCERSAARRNS